MSRAKACNQNRIATGRRALTRIKSQLRCCRSREKSACLRRFFKTAPGQYGYGDVFLGVTAPQLRRIAAAHSRLSQGAVRRLLRSPIHEERLLALFILIRQFVAADETGKRKIFRLYVTNTSCVNSWDLVDISAPAIAGAYLAGKDKRLLYRFARSGLLWERRMAIVATLYFIRQNSFGDTLRLARILLVDEHDLIHKAVGWMLREVGKRSPKDLKMFLRQHYRIMPRTMLRYAIERMPQAVRRAYLLGI